MNVNGIDFDEASSMHWEKARCGVITDPDVNNFMCPSFQLCIENLGQLINALSSTDKRAPLGRTTNLSMNKSQCNTLAKVVKQGYNDSFLVRQSFVVCASQHYRY
jgi:hypothetical protein